MARRTLADRAREQDGRDGQAGKVAAKTLATSEVEVGFQGRPRPPDPPEVEPSQQIGDEPEEQTRNEADPAAKDPSTEELGVLLSSVQPERVEWLWPGRIPLGKLTIIDGDPGLGKSVLTLDLAARVTRGQAMPCEPREPGEECEPAGVVLLSAEDGLADTIRPRLEAAGAHVDRVLAIESVPVGEGSRPPVLPDDIPLVRLACRRMEAKLVIVDPLMAYISAEHSAHKDQDIRRAMHPLAQMADETGVAVVV